MTVGSGNVIAFADTTGVDAADSGWSDPFRRKVPLTMADGVTDDTAAINTWLASLPVNSVADFGGPGNNYAIHSSGSEIFLLTRGVRIKNAFFTLLSSTSSTDVFHVKAASAGAAYDQFSFEDIKIFLPLGTEAIRHGINFDDNGIPSLGYRNVLVDRFIMYPSSNQSGGQIATTYTSAGAFGVLTYARLRDVWGFAPLLLDHIGDSCVVENHARICVSVGDVGLNFRASLVSGAGELLVINPNWQANGGTLLNDIGTGFKLIGGVMEGEVLSPALRGGYFLEIAGPATDPQIIGTQFQAGIATNSPKAINISQTGGTVTNPKIRDIVLTALGSPAVASASAALSYSAGNNTFGYAAGSAGLGSRLALGGADTNAGLSFGTNNGSGRLDLINTSSAVDATLLNTTGAAASEYNWTRELTLGKYLGLKAITAPTTPAAGFFVLYMDVADNKLKCKGPSGTVTILGLP